MFLGHQIGHKLLNESLNGITDLLTSAVEQPVHQRVINCDLFSCASRKVVLNFMIERFLKHGWGVAGYDLLKHYCTFSNCLQNDRFKSINPKRINMQFHTRSAYL